KKHSRFHVVFPKRLLGHCPALIALLPSERVTRTVQDLSAPSANRHDRRQDRGVELVTPQSGEEATVDGDRPYLRVVTTEVDILGTDLGLNAGYGRLSKGDQSLRTEAETGELETIYRKGIAWNVVPFGVCLQRRLARLRDRWRQTLFCSRGPGVGGPRPATHLVRPQRVHFALEWQRVSLRCVAHKHEMSIGQHFHPAVPGERLIFSILRYRHEFPNPAHLTARTRVHGVRRSEELTTFPDWRRSMRASECQPGCRNGERRDLAERNHRRPPRSEPRPQGSPLRCGRDDGQRKE